MTTPDTSHGPLRPNRRTAAGTDPEELGQLALAERMHDDCDPLTVQAAMWLNRAQSAISSAQAEELRPIRLSPSAFNVLLALHRTDDQTLEPCQISARLLVSRPSVTGLLDTLQAKGLVERRPHAQDGRRILVNLTPAGEALLADHLSVHYAELGKTFADLNSDELDQLVTLLRRVRGAEG